MDADPEAGVIQVGYAVIDASLHLQEASSHCRCLLANATPGVPLEELLPVFAGMETALAALRSGELPYLHLRAVAMRHPQTLREMYLELTVLPHLGRTGLFLALRDVTAQIEVERTVIQRRNELRLLSQSLPRFVPELEAATRRMEALDRERTLFLSLIVHNLQTPLTAVIAYTEWLLGEGGGSLTADQRDALGLVLSSSLRASTLSAHLLGVEGLSAGLHDIVMEAVDMAAQAQAAANLCAAAAAARGVRLAVHSAKAPAVFGVAALLREALAGLIDYLLSQVSPGGAILISIQRDPHGILVLVQAPGLHLSADERSQIFSPYWNQALPARPDTLEPWRPGLGPFLARVIVGTHGGRVWLSDEEPAAGAAFSFWLPENGLGGQGAKVDV